MSHPKIMVLSTVPTDRGKASRIKADIENGLVTVHPDQEKEILEKLNLVVSGEYSEPPVSDVFNGMFSEEALERTAQEREKKQKVSSEIKSALDQLKIAENIASDNLSTDDQIKVAKVKVQLLELLDHFSSDQW